MTAQEFLSEDESFDAAEDLYERLADICDGEPAYVVVMAIAMLVIDANEHRGNRDIKKTVMDILDTAIMVNEERGEEPFQAGIFN